MLRTFARATTQRQAVRFVSAGSKIPLTPVFHDSPGNEVDLADATKLGKSVIVGVPGAFSPACSASHVPGYAKVADQFKSKGYNDIFVVAVNDAFVTKAWAADLGTGNAVTILADPAGAFSKELDVLFDAKKFFGNDRCKRYALLVENGKVSEAFVEPDNTSIDVSEAEKVLQKA